MSGLNGLRLVDLLHSQWTAIPAVGNHEFSPCRLPMEGQEEFPFNGVLNSPLPVEKSLDPSLHETVYTVDYQDASSCCT